MDLRLQTVARMIRSVVHADVGSDHALLLVSLLRSGRVQRGIAIENKQQPFRNSQSALSGLPAEVRLSDGLESLEPREADSLSICGMGGENIVKILQAHPNRIPSRIVLQPNRRADLVRQWALHSGFRLIDEQIAWGHWPYEILLLEMASTLEMDPAYTDLERDAAIMFGPLILQRSEPRFVERLREEREYLSQFEQLKPYGQTRLRLINGVLTGRNRQ
jgi:tRNA (adenine22-N1)-methyltransferase